MNEHHLRDSHEFAEASVPKEYQLSLDRRGSVATLDTNSTISDALPVPQEYVMSSWPLDGEFLESCEHHSIGTEEVSTCGGSFPPTSPETDRSMDAHFADFRTALDSHPSSSRGSPIEDDRHRSMSAATGMSGSTRRVLTFLGEDELSKSSATYMPGLKGSMASHPSSSRSSRSSSPRCASPASAGPSRPAPQPPRQRLNGVFPTSQKAVLQMKLEHISSETTAFGAQVTEAMIRPLHPRELRQFLARAAEIRQRAFLEDSDLEVVGWPSETLKHMEIVVKTLERWEASEEVAKQLLDEIESPTSLVDGLEEFLEAWCQLQSPVWVALDVDLGIAWRATSAGPMATALMDKAAASVRRQACGVLATQFERVLHRAHTKAEFRELGIAASAGTALQELREFHESSQVFHDQEAPPAFVRALARNETHNVDKIVQEGLVNGRTRVHGHSCLWSAIAHHSTDVALKLLGHFPPGSVRGVFLEEKHSRHDSSLLHLTCGLSPFTPADAKFFMTLYAAAPTHLRAHCNAHGQNYLHVAAGQMNFWILRHAASQGVRELFTNVDSHGWSVQSLVARHLDMRKIGQKFVPLMPKSPGYVLGHVGPAFCGDRARFSDVALEVEDKRLGTVLLYAHRVVLASASETWRKELMNGQHCDASDSDFSVLKVSRSQCHHAEVAHFAVRFLYTGAFCECSFQTDSSLMLQLLALCVGCGLPATLLRWSQAVLLDLSERCPDLVRCFLEDAQVWTSFLPEARVHLARRVFGNSWTSSGKALYVALTEIDKHAKPLVQEHPTDVRKRERDSQKMGFERKPLVFCAQVSERCCKTEDDKVRVDRFPK